MSFPWAEVIRIAAAPVGVVAGPAGAFIAPGMLALANSIDREDDPETHASFRKMKQKRRESWIDFAKDLEEKKLEKLKKYPEAARDSIGRVLGESAGADLRAVIMADIHETEGRYADAQEVNLYAEAVSAKAREKV